MAQPLSLSLNDQVLVVNPKETIRFKGSFNDVITSNLQLYNPTDQPVAFKVKTTAPRQYCVKPNSGVVRPNETVTVAVMLQPFDYEPSERLRHKFMIQSVVVRPGQNADTVWTEADPSILMDCRLKVLFQNESSSNRSSTVTEEEYQMVREQNERLSIQMEELRGENELLRQQTARIRQREDDRGTSEENESLIGSESSLQNGNNVSTMRRVINRIVYNAPKLVSGLLLLALFIMFYLLARILMEFFASMPKTADA